VDRIDAPVDGQRYVELMTDTRAPAGERRVPATLLVGKPKVSVVVPCFNYRRFLAASVGSALAQQDVDVDVLVVDDCSTDGSDDVAASLAEVDDRVRLIRHTTNQGHIDTFNEGLFAVDGEYVVKLDADDMLAEGALARATALLEAYPTVGFAYGRPIHFEQIPVRRPRTNVSSWTIWGGRAWFARRCRLGVNCISNPEVVMRASVLGEVGGQRAEVPHTSDLELWLRMATVSDVGWLNRVDQAYYRVHAQSMQRTIHAGALQDLEGRRDAFLLALRERPERLPDPFALETEVRRALAAQALDGACRAYDRGNVSTNPIDDLLAFAFDVFPRATELPEWRKLERRRRVGARYASYVPPFVAGALKRRALEEIALEHRHRSGV
jgi:glycosyltransferase involved in cell wall biosynthesis